MNFEAKPNFLAGLHLYKLFWLVYFSFEPVCFLCF